MRLSTDLLEFLQQFPTELLDITRQVRQQKFALTIELKGLKAMLETHDQISNRVSFAIIIAGSDHRQFDHCRCRYPAALLRHIPDRYHRIHHGRHYGAVAAGGDY